MSKFIWAFLEHTQVTSRIHVTNEMFSKVLTKKILFMSREWLFLQHEINLLQ